MMDFFKSQEGKAEILDLYDRKLESLELEVESQTVETAFGRTHVLVTGPKDGPPLMIVHGSNGCAPIAFETYPNLAKQFRVYAVDVLAQPNRSQGVRMSMSDDSYGQWMNELLGKLNLQSVVLVGFSFGGLVILKTLENDESRIQEVFLAAPAYIANGNPLKAMFKMFIPMKRYMKTLNRKYVDRFLAEIFTARDEFAMAYLPAVFQHFEMDFTPVPTIATAAAQQIQTPIHLFGAGQDLIFPGRKVLKRAQKIFPSLKSAVLLESSKHVQNRVDNDRIEQAVLASFQITLGSLK
ncbi:alpha/beta hydrolase [Pontibacter sp. G13]|uniref:alpha/beta hydrolase n=1 Tax=Pontibacter sp. G13 TaxID=3074898 RepID=UPI00288AAF9B|nr:alpha/beta hydrolase [Pontibacter sp. G13]WNJ18356.1 alpha/beta hydrolase [Pontibacter sp. G13]